MTKDIYKKRIPPRQISDTEAPINENIYHGEDIDVTMFPAPKMWHHDGGRYIGTGDAIITRDPDSGHLNLGTYRQMIMNKRQVGFYVSPGKDALLHRERCWSRGKPCEVAAVYGTDPLTLHLRSDGLSEKRLRIRRHRRDHGQALTKW